MFRQNFHPVNLLLIAGSFLAFNGYAAEKAFELPIKVDSKYQFADGKKRTTIFSEDVRIRQGELSINADKVEVIAGQNDEGLQVFIATGQPASYSQKMDDGRVVKAQANEIKYEVGIRTLTLTGNAELQQDSHRVNSESIVYNMELKQLIAQGKEEGGVTTIFQPSKMKVKSSEDKSSNTKQDK